MHNIDRLTSDAIVLLKEIVAIPSPSFSEDKVCSHICKWMEDKGLPHERKGNNIICRNTPNSEKPLLMLCAHIDTVYPSEG